MYGFSQHVHTMKWPPRLAGVARILLCNKGILANTKRSAPKSYANLHAFDTEKVTIAEGLIWAALCAAILKRYCAHLTQRLLHVPISTRKVAMCGRHFLPAIFYALMYCLRQLTSALRNAFEYLAQNAQRAHPKRDSITGRSKTGLEPVFGSP